MNPVRISVVALVFSATLAAQTAPKLDVLPIVPALATLDFKIANQAALMVHSTGCLAMFDVSASQVVCMDPVDGTSHRFGRQGKGPGEFTRVQAMVPTGDGGTLVLDPATNRLTLINADWKLIRVVTMTHTARGLFRPTADSVFSLGGFRGSDLMAISLRDGGMVTHFSVARADSSGLFQGSNPIDYYLFWLVSRPVGGWYAVPSSHYQILALDDHGVKRSTFGRQLPATLPTPREVAARRAQLEKVNQSLPSNRNFGDMVNRFAKSPKPFIARAPTLDGQGRLWLVTGRSHADSTEVDVFDGEGQFLGTRALPGNVQSLAIRGDELFAVVEYVNGDRDGLQGVVRYRIR